MLVKFTSRSYADITMFGDVAKDMLSAMGQSGVIPGALNPQDIPRALENLQAAVDRSKTEPAAQDDDESFQPGFAQRALPLLALLQAAIDADKDVIWEQQ